jgi:hypothetical protein
VVGLRSNNPKSETFIVDFFPESKLSLRLKDVFDLGRRFTRIYTDLSSSVLICVNL